MKQVAIKTNEDFNLDVEIAELNSRLIELWQYFENLKDAADPQRYDCYATHLWEISKDFNMFVTLFSRYEA